MCLYPKLIRNRKYTENKKNGGNIPAISDIRTIMVPVGCGNCIECRKQKIREWQVRLLEDIREHTNGKFITLTFSNESIKELAGEIKGAEGYELDNAIAKLAVKRFRERWRKKYKKSIRHWLVTELGGGHSEHLHMHGIIWTDESFEEIKEKWRYGFVWTGTEGGTNYVNERTVNYCVKYIGKQDKLHENYKAIILTSPGIGSNYTNRADSERNKYRETDTREYYKTRTGHKIALPIYWRNKIYTEEEREKLWIEKLDKQERWVMGEKIDVSTEKGELEYYQTLEWYRTKNKRLGYGDDEKNWDKKRYENSRRMLKIKERIKK